MAIVMMMKWDGVSIDQYEEARKRVNWEGNKPDGAISHVCAQDGDALRVVDVWESEADLNKFLETRLMPVVVGELGVTAQPDVQILPMHARFAPLEK